MPLARTTAADVAAYVLPLKGKSRDHLPVPWTNSTAMDDCAAFCSHALWGGKPGPIIWVDGFKSAGDGSYATGSTDLRPWDVLLFDWEGNGVGNHVEFYVGPDSDARYVQTYGANGSDTKAAAYRRRPKSYIMGRFRPAYSAQSAPLTHTLSTTDPVIGDIMAGNGEQYTRYINPAHPGEMFVAGPLGIRDIGDKEAVRLFGKGIDGRAIVEVLDALGVPTKTLKNEIVHDRARAYLRDLASKAVR